MPTEHDFSFQTLSSLSGDQPQDHDYANWFKTEAIRFATSAAEKVMRISYIETGADQAEAWGDHVNPEYELRRAKATLMGLEERLGEAVSLFENSPSMLTPLQEALDEVKRQNAEAEGDFSRATNWFRKIDSLI